MNSRCTAPIRKTRCSWWQRVVSGNALEHLGSLDFMLPQQWLISSAGSPEKLLLTCVLASAVHDIATRSRAHIRDISEWISEPEAEATSRLPFGKLCRLLGLDEGWVKACLVARIEMAKARGLKDGRCGLGMHWARYFRPSRIAAGG